MSVSFLQRFSFVIMKILFAFIVILSFTVLSGLAQLTDVPQDALVQLFYANNHQQIVWFSSDKMKDRAGEWLAAIELQDINPLANQKQQIKKLRSVLSQKYLNANSQDMETDKQITSLVLHFLKDQQQGHVHFEYDEISLSRDSVYVNQLLTLNEKVTVAKFLTSIESKDPAYVLLKNYLKDSLTAKDVLKSKCIKLAMNYRLYFGINHQTEYVVVNIPSAEAEYYKDDNLVISMRVVVGRKLNPTPVFASYITNIVTFPYWNVPFTIAGKEILPKVQKDEKYLEQNNYDVVDYKGNDVDEKDLNWSKYTERTFPYFFRQSTGSDNALGVLKFNLKNPFSIFLHATSNQDVFTRTNRFLSHGCIRLEKPFELASAVMDGEIDIEALKHDKKKTESATIFLPHKVPAYIIYMPIKIVDNKIVFLPDIYGLLE